MKLENVKIERLEDYKELFDKYNITNYGELDYYINVLKIMELQKDEIIKQLDKVKKHLNSQTAQGIILPKFKVYENSIFNKELLDSIDESIPSVLLPYKMPSQNHTTILAKNQPMTIRKLRTRLQSVNEFDKNVFDSRNTKKEGIVVDSINMYDEYIDELIRFLIKKNKPINSNIFYADYDEKKEIAYDNRKEIAFNMLSNTNSFVFGNISDKSKDTMFNNICKGDNRTTNEFVDMIVNYSMLQELEKKPTNPKVIKRLIK